MIRIELDMKMPNSCDACLLQDEEFCYCHGHLQPLAWELADNYIEGRKKPTWCPLKEVNDETKRNN